MTTRSTKQGPKILSDNLFPVVGIGASAGGLNAFKTLIKAIPQNSGMAYVLVQHLDPNHDSLLPELLQKITKIPVIEISDDIKVKPDHIYIIPSNKMLVANDGVLELSPRPSAGENKRNLPIDLFFTSLAEVHQSHSIGVVLSGTASDGTLGLKAIKQYGGITFVQDDASAEHKDMPRNAVKAGVVDFILPPELIPGKLLEIKKQIVHHDQAIQTRQQQNENVIRQILSFLQVVKGTDFTYYKQTTIQRRILRRMALNKHKDLPGYLSYLRENRTEQDALYQDLLIPVTEFFRDQEVFEKICESIFPEILKNKAADDPIRVWVAGCSTGEEAYSIAICLKEFLGDSQEKVQIFATDISKAAISKARSGIYTKNEVKGLSAQRLEAFFIKTDGTYQVNKQVRDLCVFAAHDFLKDPPFGKIDLVSCRNVLIYLDPYLQKKALASFHYSLNPQGYLLLGKSDSVNTVPDLFSLTFKSEKIFSRKDVPARYMPVTSNNREQLMRTRNNDPHTGYRLADFQKTADDIILNKYTPAGVVVNGEMDIVHFRGKTSDFLEQAPGKPSHNLLKMAKPGLAFELRNILHKARKENISVTKEDIKVEANGGPRVISIEAIPMPNTVEAHYLVLFHEVSVQSKKKRVAKKVSARLEANENETRIQQLEKDLAQTREDLRSITEDQEAANEELQSGNEELQSRTEELQSLNEELQTSKEELQMTNEELTVLNQQLLGLNQEVTETNAFSEAIITTIREPLVVLDQNLRVKSANNSFYKTFQLSEAETENKFIYEIGNREWDIPDLRNMLIKILPEKSKFVNFVIKEKFENLGERVLVLNARELIKDSTAEKLILLAIDDVTEVTQTAELLRHEQEVRADYLEKAVEERTKELRDANKLLQNMNAELIAFNYVASHDLQEPLRKIQIFSGRILTGEHGNLTETGEEYFRKMQDAARRMQKLIEDLLAYSSTSIPERKFEDIDLKKIIEDLKVELTEVIQEKSATIEADNVGHARVNVFQFRQVMNNLISNSLKFSKPGEPPHIVIKSRIEPGSQLQHENLDSKKSYCHITVSDNGIGFDKQYNDRIFELFRRLHVREKYVGTGIGLAIVKKIVENHNGIIHATSELNHGATFDIYLPME